MVHIVTDTLASVPEEIAQHHNIPIVLQVVILGNESYLGGLTMGSVDGPQSLLQGVPPVVRQRQPHRTPSHPGQGSQATL